MALKRWPFTPFTHLLVQVRYLPLQIVDLCEHFIELPLVLRLLLVKVLLGALYGLRRLLPLGLREGQHAARGLDPLDLQGRLFRPPLGLARQVKGPLWQD